MRNRNEFATSYWRKASKSLPAGVRQRYASQLKSAERLELALDRLVGFFSPHRSADCPARASPGRSPSSCAPGNFSGPPPP